MAEPDWDTIDAYNAAGKQPGFKGRPGLAGLAAQSGLSNQELSKLSGFVGASVMRKQLQIAQAAKVQKPLTQGEQIVGDSTGMNLTTVDAEAYDQTTRYMTEANADGVDLSKFKFGVDDDNWFESALKWAGHAASSAGTFLVDNPVSQGVFTAFDAAQKAVMTPYRMVADFFDSANDAETAKDMKARGYDPDDLADRIAYYYQGQGVFGDTSDLVDQYGQDAVDAAKRFYNSGANSDPDAQKEFAQWMFAKGPEALSEILGKGGKKFDEVLKAVDAKHFSPGRDLAGVLNIDPTGELYKWTSGVIDGVVTLAADPTLIAGRVAKGIKVARYGIKADELYDGTRLAQVLATPRMQNTLTAYVDDARTLREAMKSGDANMAAAQHARIMAKYKNTGLDQLLSEVNGTRVVPAKDWQSTIARYDEAVKTGNLPESERLSTQAKQLKAINEGNFEFKGVDDAGIIKGKDGMPWVTVKSKPIETPEEMAEYLNSSLAYVRMGLGSAARRTPMIPGALSMAARAKGAAAARRVEKGEPGNFIIDHTRPLDNLAIGGETDEVAEELLKSKNAAAENAADLAANRDGVALTRNSQVESGSAYAKRGAEQFNQRMDNASLLHPIKNARQKFERTSRALTTYVPSGSHIDFAQPSSVKLVQDYARAFMSKSDASKFAFAYAAGDIAQRREIWKGVVEQSFHQSGLMLSASGREMYSKFMKGVDDAPNAGAYDVAGEGRITPNDGTAPRDVTINPSQVNNYGKIPELKLMQQMASKVATYERYMGETAATLAGGANKGAVAVNAAMNPLKTVQHGVARMLNSEHTDQFMNIFKLSKLLSPASAMRNVLDEYAGLLLRGEYGDFAAQRAVTRNTRKSLERYKFDANAQAYVHKRTGQKAENLQQALEQVIEGRGNRLSALADRIRQFHLPNVTGHSGSLTREEMLARYTDNEGIGALDDLLERMDMNGDLSKEYRSLSDRGSINDSLEKGFAPVGVKQQFQTKYGPVSLESEQGLEAWKAALFAKFDGRGYAEGAIHFLEKNDFDGAVRFLQGHIRGPEGKKFQETSEWLRYNDDGSKALTTAEREQRMDQWAEVYANDLVHVLGGKPARESKTGQPVLAFNPELIAALKNKGKVVVDEKGAVVPGKYHSLDESLLEKVPADFRPTRVIGKSYLPLPSATGRWGGGMTAALGKSYEFLANKHMRKLSREPMFDLHYAQAKKNLQPLKQKYIENGFSEEAAEAAIQRTAGHAAITETAARVDNAAVSSQFSLIARNFWLFYRAQEDWLRRWGRLMKEDPTVIRKGQLAIEGGMHSGFIDRDANGNLMFTYPGSNLVMQAIARAGALTGLYDAAMIPSDMGLSSNLMFLNASLDNPIGFNGSPLITTPVKFFKMILPQWQTQMQDLDSVASGGQLGAGTNILESFMPSPVLRAFKLLSPEDQDSQVNSAGKDAIVALDAAGKLPPPNATPGEIDEFRQNVLNLTTISLATRGIMAMFLPASPGQPNWGDMEGGGLDELLFGGTSKASGFYAAEGLASLSDEWKKVLADNDMDYGKAMQYWAAVHPDKQAYTVGQSEAGGGGEYVPPTRDVSEFLQKNRGFAKKYSDVMSFFVPKNPGQFDMNAYNAQLELGLRQKKDLKEFYTDVRVRNAQSTYFDQKSKYDDLISKAKSAGHDTSDFEDAWANWKSDFLTKNPLLAEQFANYASTAQSKSTQRAQISQIVKEGSSPIADPQILALITSTYDKYQAYRKQNAGNSKLAKANRDLAKSEYTQMLAQITAKYPQYADLYKSLYTAD